MSDLQKMLLVIGAAIILSVLAFNWFQERRHKKHIEKKIAQNTNDPLMQEISEAFEINEDVRIQDSSEQEIDLTNFESNTQADLEPASDLSSANLT
jgi:FtsZ-interacting cell division protein ZipA